MNAFATTRRHTLVRTVLLGLAGGLSLGAHAGEAQRSTEVTTSVAVSYADLDIASAAGAKTLYARIRSAARKVCGPEPSGLDLHGMAAYDACFQGAVSRAVHRVGSDRLQALHAVQSGKSRAG